jgi:hypothetical protein
MEIFIKNTKDMVEQLYGSEITKLFPNYAKFWEEFIGDPKKGIPVPYGLLFDSSICAKDREQINEIYNEICMSHYSLFCHLAGTHFQLENLKNILKLDNSKRKYFQHWETFEVCYFHLGSAFYQMYHLWGLIFLLKKEVTRDANGQFRPSVKEKLKNYLNNEGQGSLCGKIDELDEGIKDLRDSIVHFSRGAAKIVSDEFWIPFKIEQRTWARQHRTNKWLETFRKIKKDLEETEKLINSIHGFLIKEFREFLITSRIKVNR